MKKLLLLLATVGMIFTACEGGESVEEDNGGTPFVPEITISPKYLTFGCNGGEQAVDITANFEYEVAERASWITVEQTDEGLLVIVDANKNTSERSAFISITNSQYNKTATINIKQQGCYAILYTSSNGSVVTPYRMSFGANIVSNTYTNGQGEILFDAPITSIGNYAFRDCTSLTSVTIPDSVTSIVRNAFYNCTGELVLNCKCLGLYGGKFTKVTIGNSVTEIGDDAFYACHSLTRVTIPDSVTEIGYNAFSDCTSLTSVTIPDSVTEIGWHAFSDCYSLKEVYCKPITPPTGASNMFSYYDWADYGDKPIGCKIYVPRYSVSAYKAKQYWKDYASYIVGYDF